MQIIRREQQNVRSISRTDVLKRADENDGTTEQLHVERSHLDAFRQSEHRCRRPRSDPDDVVGHGVIARPTQTIP